MDALNEFEPKTINYGEFEPETINEHNHLRRDFYNAKLPKAKYNATKCRTDKSKNESHLNDKDKQFKRKHKRDDKNKRADRQYKDFKNRQIFIQMIDDEYYNALLDYNGRFIEIHPEDYFVKHYGSKYDGDNDSEMDPIDFIKYMDAINFIKEIDILSR